MENISQKPPRTRGRPRKHGAFEWSLTDEGRNGKRRLRKAQQQQHKVYHRALTIEWATPPVFFAALDAEFRFTLDVCATAANATCPRYFTRAEDGLSQDWGQAICWMNPPYGRQIGAWMAKAAHSAQQGALVVALVPVRTDTAWWQAHVLEQEVRYVKGRLTFGGASHPAPFPNAVVIFRPAAVDGRSGV